MGYRKSGYKAYHKGYHKDTAMEILRDMTRVSIIRVIFDKGYLRVLQRLL